MLNKARKQAKDILNKLLKKSSSIIYKEDQILFDKPFNDLIPYSCHYDKDTILTKNGELLQIIKIPDFFYNDNNHEYHSKELRQKIRNAIKSVTSTKFSFWIHTIRDKKKISIKDDQLTGFSADLFNSYSSKYKTNYDYFNDIYISIIAEGANEKMTTLSIISSLYFSYIRKKHLSYLKQIKIKLEAITQQLLDDLSTLGAKKLSLKQTKDGVISEQLGFLSYLLNFEKQKHYLKTMNLSTYLLDKNKVAYGFNSLEIITNDNENNKKFIALFVIKDYTEVSTSKLDALLHIPRKMIITQSCTYISKIKNITQFDKYNQSLQLTNAKQLSEDAGIIFMNIQKELKNNTTKFMEHIITITVIEDSINQLEASITDVSSALSKIGFIFYRADIRLEQLFWSRFPANFAFFTKKYILPTEKCASFASLHSFPAGIINGGTWGCSVTLFRSIQDHYYFFNFHAGHNGHTCITGHDTDECVGLANFLISMSTKFNIKILCLDYDNNSQIFIKALNKKYTHIKNAFNPLYIKDSDQNRKMISNLIMRMCGPLKDKNLLNKMLPIIENFVNVIFEKYNKDDRTFSKLEQLLSKLPNNIQEWYNKGTLSDIFDNKNGVAWDNNISGIDLTHVYNNSTSISAVLHFILYNFEKNLDGSPTILMLNHSWKIISTFLKESIFLEWLKTMQKLNVVIIFITNTSEIQKSERFLKAVHNNTATQIIFPLNHNLKKHTNTLNLTEEEFIQVSSMVKYDRNLFVKNNNESIVLKMDISDIKENKVLYTNKSRLTKMHEAIKETENIPNKWLPVFYKKVHKE